MRRLKTPDITENRHNSSYIEREVILFMKVKNHVEYYLEFVENNIHRMSSIVKDPLVPLLPNQIDDNTQRYSSHSSFKGLFS